MRFARNVLVLAIAVMVFCATSLGQVLKQVPSDAWVVVKISNLEATNKKMADLAKLLGLDKLQPEMADPMAAALAQAGITQGLDKKGDMAIAVMDFSKGAAPDIVMLLPVSDYKAFLANWPDAKTEADITSMTLDGEPTYVANWGAYAALSPSKELLATKPGGLTVGGVAGKELDGKDMVVFVNLKAMRPTIVTGIDNARQTAGAALDAMAGQQPNVMLPANFAKMGPLLKVGLNQVLDLAKGFISDADSATLSTNLSPDGVALTETVEFAAGSAWGNRMARVKNTDVSLLAGLPQGKYVAFGGSQSDPEIASEILGNVFDAVVKQTAEMGDQGQAIADLVAAAKMATKAQTGAAFGVVAPTGPLGVEPLLQFISIQHGDAKVLADAQHKATDAQQALIKSLGLDANPPKTVFTAAAKTVGGVSFDEYQTPLAATDPQNPQAMIMQGMMRTLLGNDGMVLYSGSVDDKTRLNVSGLPDETITATIDAIKAGDDPLAKIAEVKWVAGQLPAKRTAAIYIPLDVLVTTGLDFAKASGMNFGVTMPENLPPIGITVATEGTALRIDGFMPSQLMQAVTSAGIMIYMSRHAPPEPEPGL